MLFPIHHSARAEKDDKGETKNKVRLDRDKVLLIHQVITVDTINKLLQHLHPNRSSPHPGVTWWLSSLLIHPSATNTSAHVNWIRTATTAMNNFLCITKESTSMTWTLLPRCSKNITQGNRKAWASMLLGLRRQCGRMLLRGSYLEGFCAKFHQNPEHACFLGKTGEKKMYEASPWDTFYRVRLSLFNMDSWDGSNHRGSNLIGKSLMTLRS